MDHSKEQDPDMDHCEEQDPDMDQLIGKKPKRPPPRSEDFEELERKMIDVLIDAMKYITTTCGIAIAIYSQVLRQYLDNPQASKDPFAKFLVFAPLLLWFLAIVGTVLGVFPREYEAKTDLAKQQAMEKIRKTKKFWLTIVLVFFLSGFAVFVYIMGAQIWNFFPF